MGHFIRDAGFGIWPVLFFGIFGLVVAVRYATQPTRDRLALIVGLAIATLLMGVLGSVVGVQTSAAVYAESGTPPLYIFLIGLRESLNNAVAALMFVTIQTLVATYGARRMLREAQLRA